MRLLRHEIAFLATDLWGDDGTFDPSDEAEREDLVEKLRYMGRLG